jgi:hypothetical protein
MVGASWWKGRWVRLWLHVRRLVQNRRLRRDYLKLAGIPSGTAASWMDGEERLLALSRKEVETVGGETCHRELSY